MTKTSRLLARSHALLEAGRWEDAVCVLEAVIQATPEDDAVWALYLKALPDDAARIEALRRLVWACADNPIALRRAVSALKTLSASRPESRRGVDALRPQRMGPAQPAPAPARTPTAAPSTATARHPGLRVLLGFAICAVIGALGVWLISPEQQQLRQQRADYEGLLATHQQLEASHAGLTDDYNTLVANYYTLRTEQQSLESDYVALGVDYGQLQSAHSQLQADYGTLQGDYNELFRTHSDLLSRHTALQQSHEALSADYESLRSVAITPPYILIEGRRVHLAFVKLDNSIVEWQVPFETLEASIQRGHEARDSWINRTSATVKLRTDDGRTIRITDHRRFVDPEPFRSVIGALYGTAPDDETFLRELWHIVTQLSTYTAEVGDVPRYPLETLLAGGGDCEDTSVLLASLIRAAPVSWDVHLVYVDSNNLGQPQEANHVIVHVDTGMRRYHIETTTDWAMEPYTSVEGWYLEVN